VSTCVARRVSRRACACLRASALTPGQAEGGVRVSPRRGIASHPVPRGIAGAPHVLQARGKECHQRRELQRIALGTHGEGRGGGWGTSPALNLGRTPSEWLSSWANPTNEYKIWHSTICCCSKTGSTPRALGSEQSSPCHPWNHSHWPMFGDVRCLMALSVGTACLCAAWLARTGGVRALCVRVAGAGAPWLPRSPALARQPTHNPGVQSFAV